MLAYSNVSAGAQYEKLSTRTNIFRLKKSCNDVKTCTLLDHIEKAQHIQKVFSKTFFCWALYIIGNQALVIKKFRFSRQVSIFLPDFSRTWKQQQSKPRISTVSSTFDLLYYLRAACTHGGRFWSWRNESSTRLIPVGRTMFEKENENDQKLKHVCDICNCDLSIQWLLAKPQRCKSKWTNWQIGNELNNNFRVLLLRKPSEEFEFGNGLNKCSQSETEVASHTVQIG